MTTLIALAERVEGLQGPDREVDGLIARTMGWHRVEPRHHHNRYGAWIAPQDFIGIESDGRPRIDSLRGTEMHRHPPALTASLDAVVALIAERLPGWSSLLLWPDASSSSKADASLTNGKLETIMAAAKTPALALLAAALRALSKDTER